MERNQKLSLIEKRKLAQNEKLQRKQQKLLGKTEKQEKNVDVYFLKTQSPYFSLQIQIQSESKNSGQLNSLETEMVKRGQVSLGLIQMLTKLPVEFHFGIGEGTFQMSLSLKGSVSNHGKYIQNYIEDIYQVIPKDVSSVIIISSGQTELEQDKKWVLEHVLKQAIFSQNSLQEKAVTNFSEGGKKIIDGLPKKFMRVNQQILHTILSLGQIPYEHEDKQKIKISSGIDRSLLFDQNGQISDKTEIGMECLEFYKQFLMGDKTQKNQKIGDALQLMISSAGFNYKQLKETQQEFEQLYSQNLI